MLTFGSLNWRLWGGRGGADLCANCALNAASHSILAVRPSRLSSELVLGAVGQQHGLVLAAHPRLSRLLAGGRETTG